MIKTPHEKNDRTYSVPSAGASYQAQQNNNSNNP